MKPSPIFSFATFAILAAIVPASGATSVPASEASKYSFVALIENSPFKSVLKDAKNFRAGAATASKQVRFLGILKIDGETEFGIYDPVALRSYWLKLRERDDSGLYIESYNEAQKSIVLQSNSTGRLVLALATPDEKPIAVSGGAYRGVPTPAPARSAPATRQNTRPQNSANRAAGTPAR